MQNEALAVKYRTLGDRLLRRGQLDEAREYYLAALSLNALDPEVHEGLGGIEAIRGHLQDAIDHYRRGLAFEPNSTGLCNNLGTALVNIGRITEAREEFRRLIAMNPEDAVARCNLGTIDLLLADFADGWQGYEWRLQATKFVPRLQQQYWRGEPIDGETIVLHPEQGFGDVIQFCRYAPLVAARGARVVLKAPQALHHLLCSLSGVDEVLPIREPVPSARWVCLLPSLPSVFKTDLQSIPADIPYLFVDRTAQATFREQLDPNAFNVGLVWAGNPQNLRDPLRSMSLHQLAPLFQIDGVSMFSLQYGPATAQIAEQPFRDRVRRFEPAELEFSNMAAAMMVLDLVITIDTSSAHLAGALGRPVWILLPYVPDWRWMLETERSPWYPSARLWRQPASADWDSVVRRVAGELRDIGAHPPRRG